MTFPFRFQRCHVDDNAAASVGGLAETNRQYRSRNAEVLDRASQRKGIRRNDTNITLQIDKAAFIKRLWIDNCRVDIGEYLELIRTAHVVAVTGCSVGYDTSTGVFANLAGLKGFDHALLRRHAANPAIRLNAHLASSTTMFPNFEL